MEHVPLNIDSRMAEKVLACIGSQERITLLLALLNKPMTVAELVGVCGCTSAGQVYHHMKPLMAADLVAEDRKAGRGVYAVVPHRAQGIVMLLAGIQALADTKYAAGDWEPGTQIHKGATAVDERYMTTPAEERKVVETYFVSLDPPILKAFPPKEKKKLVILRVIAGRFEPERRYSEKEVNAILGAIYEDYTTIRRYLIDYGFMERTKDGREYWLK